MAKFAYRMQSILDIKEKMEGQAKMHMELQMQNSWMNRENSSRS